MTKSLYPRIPSLENAHPMISVSKPASVMVGSTQPMMTCFNFCISGVPVYTGAGAAMIALSIVSQLSGDLTATVNLINDESKGLHRKISTYVVGGMLPLNASGR